MLDRRSAPLTTARNAPVRINMNQPHTCVPKYQVAVAVFILFVGLSFSVAQAPPLLPPESRLSIDEIAKNALATTGVPSASLAVVVGGKVAYLQAYGNARLEPRLAATPRCNTASAQSASNLLRR